PVRVLPPLSYLDFLGLHAQAALVLTDSGGLQEEACSLGIPCVTLRDNTERPESVDVGANVPADAAQRTAAPRAEGKPVGYESPLPLLGVLAGALLLRLSGLGARSIWTDE